MGCTGLKFAAVMVPILAVGCGDNLPSSDPANEQLVAELQVAFDAYTRGLLERDAQTLDGLLSIEVKKRATQMGSDVGGFADKMRASLLRQFPTIANESTLPEFKVTSATVEGDTARAQVAFQGEALAKPFFFVSEGGQYKLNIARAGFSNPLPAGTAASVDGYVIESQNGGYGGDMMYCNGGNVYVPVSSKRTVSCVSNCGWWTGTWFNRNLEGPTLNCDYNTWGTDVYINLAYAYGWTCNDYC
jgi:hypothetical protein